MTDKLLIDVLRAAGHADAADLAEKMSAATSAGATAAGPETKSPPTQAPSIIAPATQAGADAEGRYVLDTLKRSLPDKFAA